MNAGRGECVRAVPGCAVPIPIMGKGEEATHLCTVGDKAEGPQGNGARGISGSMPVDVFPSHTESQCAYI